MVHPAIIVLAAVLALEAGFAVVRRLTKKQAASSEQEASE